MFAELEAFLQLKEEDSIQTAKNYRQPIEKFILYFSIQAVEDFEHITAKAIRDFRNTLGVERHSSINTYMRYIKSFWNFLRQEEKISNNAIALVKPLKEQKTQKVIPSDEDFDKLLKVCKNEQEELSIRIFFEAGFRKGEAISVCFRDVNYEKGHITVVRKGGNICNIQVTSRILDLIDALDYDNPDDYIFCSQKLGTQITPTGMWSRIKSIGKRAGVDEQVLKFMFPHIGRHYFVSTVIERTGDIYMAQKLANHSSVQTTERYAHLKKRNNIVQQIFG